MLKFALAFALALASCQQRPASPVTYELDSTVAISFEPTWSRHWRTHCAGALVDGLVITAAHCVDEPGRYAIKLRHDGALDYTPVAVLLIDESQDLAVLEARAYSLPSGLRIASLAPSHGDPVQVIGHPFGIEWTYTTGVVSHPHRQDDGLDWIQVSAPINPGNSGGPVMNERGELVAIVSFTLATLIGDGHIGGAIHTDRVREIYQRARRMRRVALKGAEDETC